MKTLLDWHSDRLFDRIPDSVHAVIKIAIVRALPGLGDWLCFVPTLRSLKAALPNAEITLIGLSAAQGLTARFTNYFDRWLDFPGYPGIPEVPLSPSQTVAFLQTTQQQFDWALQLHGSGSYINEFTQLLGAAVSAGFYPEGFARPDRHFFPYPERLPEIWRNLHLLEQLGISPQGDALEFPITAADWQAWQQLCQVHSLMPGYVCLHPGASVSERRWSVRQFVEVAQAIAYSGPQIVLTGTAAEATLTQTIAQALPGGAIDLAGQTNLGLLAALLKRSRLLICNDTGVSHLAAALRVNSVVIFSNSDVDRWAPLDQQRHRRVCRSAEPDVVAAVVASARSLLLQEMAHVSY